MVQSSCCESPGAKFRVPDYQTPAGNLVGQTRPHSGDRRLKCFLHRPVLGSVGLPALAAFYGPWKIYDYYITVARWSLEFDETAPIRKVLTWVRLPKLPIHYFNNVPVSGIGNYIGRTVRLDLATKEGSRGRFARLCVEVDLSKPLLAK
ncbi:hypothetical protein LINGRAHAP2_LOCUS13836 [Linum grandiflorum]